MIVSDPHKFLFLSVPKTGSGTVQTHLQDYGWRSEGAAHLNHLTVEQMKEHEKIGINKWKAYRKICFVRNPWDRWISLWIWTKRFHEKHENRDLYPTFADYLKTNGKEGMHQSWFLLDQNGEFVVDFVGKFELFEDDISKMCDFIKIPRPQSIIHTNQNHNENRVHYTKYYTEEWMKDVVAKTEKFTIEKYGYEFGKDGERWK